MLALPGPLSGMVRCNSNVVLTTSPETYGVFTQVGAAQLSRSKSAFVMVVMQS